LNGGGALEVTLSNAVTVTNTLTLTSGKVILGANNLNIGASGAISGGSSSSFVVTNSTGVLKQLSIDGSAAAGKKVFPIGLSTSSYTPMILANAGTSDDFSARVTSGVLQSGTSGNAITTKHINKLTEKFIYRLKDVVDFERVYYVIEEKDRPHIHILLKTSTDYKTVKNSVDLLSNVHLFLHLATKKFFLSVE
jgi:hypothetical protein